MIRVLPFFPGSFFSFCIATPRATGTAIAAVAANAVARNALGERARQKRRDFATKKQQLITSARGRSDAYPDEKSRLSPSRMSLAVCFLSQFLRYRQLDLGTREIRSTLVSLLYLFALYTPQRREKHIREKVGNGERARTCDVTSTVTLIMPLRTEKGTNGRDTSEAWDL